MSLWAFVLVRDLNLAEASLKSRAKIGEKETVRKRRNIMRTLKFIDMTLRQAAQR